MLAADHNPRCETSTKDQSDTSQLKTYGVLGTLGGGVSIVNFTNRTRTTKKGSLSVCPLKRTRCLIGPTANRLNKGCLAILRKVETKARLKTGPNMAAPKRPQEQSGSRFARLKLSVSRDVGSKPLLRRNARQVAVDRTCTG